MTTWLLHKIGALFALYSLLLILSLVSWSVFATYYALNNSNETLIIAIDSSGTRYVTRIDDPILRTEKVNFLKYFFSSLYNFTPDTFTDSVGSAAELMSQALWAREESKPKALKTKVKSRGIFNKARVVKILRDSDVYEVHLSSRTKEKLIER